MADENEKTSVHVFSSNRMSNGDPDDTMHGKRFTDPKTGKPASIVDILESMGVVKPEPKEENPDT